MIVAAWIALSLAGPSLESQPITPSGLGQIRIGAPLDRLGALGFDFQVPSGAENACSARTLPQEAGLTIHVSGGRVHALAFGEGARWRTDRDVGVGASKRAVLGVYGETLDRQVDPDLGEPAETMIFTERTTKRTLTFVIGQEGTVVEIAIGEPLATVDCFEPSL